MLPNNLYFGKSLFLAKFTNAASVGSPIASLSPFFNVASLHSAIAVASNLLSFVLYFVTVILFWVRVPVLSVQMICVHPNVSTALILRINAFLLAIDVTPIDKIIVTIAGNPSGIAATARAIATINVSKTVSPDKDLALTSPAINTKILINTTSLVSTFDISAIFF